MNRLLAFLSVLSICAALIHGGNAVANDALQLTIGQSDLLHKEPVLVTLRLQHTAMRALPSKPGEDDGCTLRFEFEPAIQPRAKGKPLPLEAASATAEVTSRDYELLEWYAIPKEGTFSVRAVLELSGAQLTSQAVKFTIRAPASADSEHGPVDRIHHLPWMNYDTNKYCGDTFDLVKRWPDSRLAKYCHYWNGRYSQNNQEYEEAIASYRIVIEKYPRFALSDDADFGIVECLRAQGDMEAAKKHNAAVLKKYGAAADGTRSAVHFLATGMTGRIARTPGAE
jgi:tetratricopeptide (TPR) repeat protein